MADEKIGEDKKPIKKPLELPPPVDPSRDVVKMLTLDELEDILKQLEIVDLKKRRKEG